MRPWLTAVTLWRGWPCGALSLTGVNTRGRVAVAVLAAGVGLAADAALAELYAAFRQRRA
ncbi:hypothetical protein JZM24_01840 [Candidatus Sodalis endolongispinus]|uniref:Uncharacterized protein n=1 Tax=Candidatus Sodalis endolongispinus TaxID=2812662 RepID=A0ABS5YAR6_9GAMM|nr:hypothetical protein [Candidatus Sodalis endolongispinus]